MGVEAAWPDTTVLLDVIERDVADFLLVGVAEYDSASLTEDEEAAFAVDEEETFAVDEEVALTIDEDATDKIEAAELAGVVVLPETPNSAFLQDPAEHL